MCVSGKAATDCLQHLRIGYGTQHPLHAGSIGGTSRTWQLTGVRELHSMRDGNTRRYRKR